ncbi:MAG: MarR family winged helix-turn-helix transcriptional regulator [Actinomycetota bacterium]
MSRSDPKRAVASDVWRSMLQFAFMHQSRRWMSDAREMGLTPGHMKALMVLQPGELRPMGGLADAMGCDASTCTWLVDRLEERGLVERRPSTKDRRVKAVVLTPAGVEMKENVHERMYEPPPDLIALDRESLETLRSALHKLPRSASDTPAADSA